MQSNMKIGAVAVAMVIALTVSVVGANQVWAQAVDEPAETTIFSRATSGTGGSPDSGSIAIDGSGRETIREEIHQAGLEAAAGLLGMTPEELSDLLWGGKMLADLAEEANVPLADLRAAVEEATSAVRQERIEAFIAKQVENGRITQERADWVLAGINNGWFGLRRFAGSFDGLGEDGFGWGNGRGLGRMRMHEQAHDGE